MSSAQGAPIVVKADGLAAGKGVVVAADRGGGGGGGRGALRSRSRRADCLIEACLQGEEVSFFALCDGERAVAFGDAQDHKRAGDGDTGPNTGGMGAYSPSPLIDAETSRRIMRRQSCGRQWRACGGAARRSAASCSRGS